MTGPRARNASSGKVASGRSGGKARLSLPILVMILAGVGWFFDGLIITLYNVLVPGIQQTLHLTMTTIGIIGSLFLVGYTLGTFMGGTLADYIGRKGSLSLSIGFYSVMAALTGLSGSFNQLGLWRSLTGVGGGMELPVASVYMTETWPQERRGWGSGIMYAFYSYGAVLASILAGFFLFPDGWRYAFGACLVIGLAIFFARKKLLESPRYLRVTELERKQVQVRSRLTLRDVFRRPYGRAYLGWALAWIGTEYAWWSYSVFFPSFLKQQGGLSMKQMLVFMAIIPLVATVLVILSGGLSGRFGRRPVGIGYAVLGGLSMLFLTSVHLPALLLLGGILVYGFFQGPWVTGLLGTSESFPTAIRGTSTSAVLTTGRIVALFAPTVTGILATQYSLALAFRLGSLALILTIVGFLISKETRHLELEDVPEERASLVEANA